MKQRSRLLALLLPVCATVIPAIGQSDITAHPTPVAATAPTVVPALVPYTANAFGSDGKPLTGETLMTFQLYKDEQGGEPLWVESQTIAIDSSGRYQAQLGAGSPIGLPLDTFASGESRWLEVQIAGQKPAPRVLLMSVPYAMKAADAATLGGLPASAFALVGSNGVAAGTTPGTATPDAGTTVTTTGGTANKVAKFSGSNTIVNSSLYDNGTEVGIGTTSPTSTLTVAGTLTMNGPVLVNPTATATSSTAYDSQQLKFYASAYNSSSKAVNTPHFIWQAEPTGNNTSSPGTTLNLLAATANNGAAETGFYLNSNGTIHFAAGQTFPGGSGAGTITGVTAGTGLTGGGTSGKVTLSVNTGTVPTLSGANSFTGSNTFVPSLYEDKDVNIDNTNANPGNISPGLRLGQASGEGMSSKRTSGGNQYGVDIYTGYSPRLSINAAGQVAIGTGATFGGAQLQVQSGDAYAVYGETSYNTYQGAAVYGLADSAAIGVIGSSSGGNGGEFFGGASSGGLGQYGIYALGGSSTGNQENGGYGVFGYGGEANGDASYGGHGGYFKGGDSTYVGGFGGYFIGGDSSVIGQGGYGIFVTGGNGSNGSGPDEGFSAVFQQNISVNGTTFNSAQNIKIDHPADPANKSLVHAAVASSEQMNLYSGNVTTDDLGVATVTLPTWFQDLNTDFRYQLTVVGGRFAQAIVSKEIAGNQFTISTNASGVKVSWQVTAVRQDAYAKAHPLVVEQVKGPRERGFYQHPELYGQPKEKQTEWGLHPQAMAQLKAGEYLARRRSKPSKDCPTRLPNSIRLPAETRPRSGGNLPAPVPSQGPFR